MSAYMTIAIPADDLNYGAAIRALNDISPAELLNLPYKYRRILHLLPDSDDEIDPECFFVAKDILYNSIRVIQNACYTQHTSSEAPLRAQLLPDQDLQDDELFCAISLIRTIPAIYNALENNLDSPGLRITMAA